ncbi:hypothetical protein GPX89_30845 [Nocardia sp. ET3-3]|uniref:Uncharacterized protein n=1 Tax=Nocardia terrae TaxID=2675851 RepID=A0A7K1V4Q7_9NOCA|nr:hypothetical protein [Nocardia terrae]MVU81625.1 hypothetical protein [Nocardia terrae]
MKNIRRVGLSAAGIAAISATVAAPFAAADTTANGLTVSGSGYTVGATYTITVNTGASNVSANVFDNNVSVGTASPSGSNTTAAIYWTPNSTGTHHITVQLNGSSTVVGPVDVTVAAASNSNTTNTGSASSIIPMLTNTFGGSSANSRVS